MTLWKRHQVKRCWHRQTGDPGGKAKKVLDIRLFSFDDSSQRSHCACGEREYTWHHQMRRSMFTLRTWIAKRLGSQTVILSVPDLSQTKRIELLFPSS
jgi:hypothetical protein